MKYLKIFSMFSNLYLTNYHQVSGNLIISTRQDNTSFEIAKTKKLYVSCNARVSHCSGLKRVFQDVYNHVNE